MNKYEQRYYSDISKIAKALEKIAKKYDCPEDDRGELIPTKDEEIEQLRKYIRELEGQSN